MPGERKPVKTYLEQALRTVFAELGNVPEDFMPEFERPNNPEHGDLSTNAAMRLARHLRRTPRSIAEELVQALREGLLDGWRIRSIEVAGSGFINFRFSEEYLAAEVGEILAAGDAYGRAERHGRRALVEYVSANPTGPLTVGHGRNAVLGDTIANLLDWSGYDVTREYYFNDAGRQMRVLGESVRARYQALLEPDGPRKRIDTSSGMTVEVPESFPEDGYLGTYITEIAEQLFAEASPRPGSRNDTAASGRDDTAACEGTGTDALEGDVLAVFRDAAEKAIFADIQDTLARLGIHMDAYFNEQSLYEDGRVWKALERLREEGFCYDRDGAVWFETTAFGKKQDTVLVRSSGEPTYRLPDIAYHADKYDRGFDRIVDIFGADHIATYPDVLDGLRVLGYDTHAMDVVIYQFVTLVRGNEPVKMSTRQATYVTLDDLIDEVGEDVTRYFFLMRSPHAHLEFDLDLAREASEKNPVFYLQYAHARICSILTKAGETGFEFDDEADRSQLLHHAEIDLMKALRRFPEVVERAAIMLEPHQVANYLREVAVAFTQFYGHCRILGEEKKLATARMQLARAARVVLANGLRVLGVSRPEHM